VLEISDWRLEIGKVGITLVMRPGASANLILGYCGWRTSTKMNQMIGLCIDRLSLKIDIHFTVVGYLFSKDNA
jgi:hypothetical protein